MGNHSTVATHAYLPAHRGISHIRYVEHISTRSDIKAINAVGIGDGDRGRDPLVERPFERRKRNGSRTNFLYFSLAPDLQMSTPSFGSAIAYALCLGSHGLLLFSFPPAYPFPFLSLLRLFSCLASDVGWWPTAIGRGRNICRHDDAGHLFSYLLLYSRPLKMYLSTDIQ